MSVYRIFGADECDELDATSGLISSMLPRNNKSFICSVYMLGSNILTWTCDLKMLQQYNSILF